MKKKYIIINTITQETFEYTFPWSSLEDRSTVYTLDINGIVMETTAIFEYGEFNGFETCPSTEFVLHETIEL